MANWAKINFFYDTMLGKDESTLSATSTEPTDDYSVDYIYTMLEWNKWMANDSLMADTQYITFDGGSNNSYEADYLIIDGHNLNLSGAIVVLQYSTDNFQTDINDCFSPLTVSGNSMIMKEFISPGLKRYWRLKISNLSVIAPYMATAIWGLKTELDWVSASFDPHSQTVMGNVNISYGGYVTGVHENFRERKLSLKFHDAENVLYEKIKNWWDSNGLKNFYVAWDKDNAISEIYLMRPGKSFNNPFDVNSTYRNISINLTGRAI